MHVWYRFMAMSLGAGVAIAAVALVTAMLLGDWVEDSLVQMINIVIW